MASTVVRDIPVSCKLSDVERRALERVAKVEHLTLSEAQRMALKEAAERRGVWPAALTLNARGGRSIDSVEGDAVEVTMS